MSDTAQYALVDSEDLIDLRALITVFRRRFWSLLATGFVTFVAVVVFTLQATPLYTATASVVLNLRDVQTHAGQTVAKASRPTVHQFSSGQKIRPRK